MKNKKTKPKQNNELIYVIVLLIIIGVLRYLGL